MDYLPEEKQRGITITSAAITLEWPPSPPHTTTPDILSLPIHTINLIDTPGHADFTFEVERSIRVLDGAVTILDGVAGVEAQTETVWRQADRYHIPRIIYVNKMDREGAVFGRVVKDIAARLNVWPAVTQIPIHGNVKEGLLGGVVDLLHMNIINWNPETEGRGMALTPLESIKEKHPGLYAEAIKARTALVELLAEWDEAILSKFVETEDQASVTALDLKRALRFCTLNPHTKVIPVLMGASRVNMGVQPVLDAVLDYLPDPTECGKDKIPVMVHGEKALLDAKEASKVCALVFKVMHDPKRGMLSYVRVYSGTLRAGDQLYNTTLQSRERALKLLRMYANEAVDIPSIRTGHIGVIVNYKNSRTGDTLIHADHVTNLPSSTSSIQNFKQQKREKKFKKKIEKAGKHIDILTDATLQLRPIDVPPPVFFASLEPNSAADERGMQDALAIIEREDPSLHISTDEDSGQMVLSGMGELHLEISRNRLVSDLKAKCSMGHIRIGYREVVTGSTAVHETYEREILGKKSYAGVTAYVEAISNYEGATFEEPLGILAKSTIGGNEIIITVQTTQELEDPTLKIPGWMDPEALVDNLTNGAMAALSRGPQNFELHSTRVILTLGPSDFRNSSESTPNAFMVAARMGVEKAVRECGTGMMEPFMNVVVSCEEGDVGNVVADITSGAGGGSVLSLDDETDSIPAPTSIHTGGTYDTSSSSSTSVKEEVEYIDVSKVYAPPQSYRSTGVEKFDEGAHVRTKLVRCRVPLAKMMGYVKHLKSMTKGRGTFVMSMDRFERMSDVRIRNAMR
ncbi:uncharacterized protein DFL_006423 [Arthrobotrys flagrans]|uniref:Elongation factor 2 n=1 Tax=Arthrobotrys flagrans TaxID=97331 RepID=A0A437A110_ARTFL|nr:hypothetical protein DFL_006423 [Arthrobotrys flagrans]